MPVSVGLAWRARQLALVLVVLSLLLPSCDEPPPAVTTPTPTPTPETWAVVPPATFTPAPGQPGLPTGGGPAAVATPTATTITGQQTTQQVADVPSTWLKAWGAESELTGTAIVAANDGGYFVAGYLHTGPAEVLVLKVDGEGQVLWRQQYAAEDKKRLILSYGDSYLHDFTGPPDHYWIDLVATHDGGLALSLGPRLLRLGQKGEFLWARVYTPGTRAVNPYTIAGLVELDDGGFALAGAYRTTKLATDYDEDDTVLLRVGKQGEVRWAQEYKGLLAVRRPGLVRTGRDTLLLGTRAAVGKNNRKVALSEVRESDGELVWTQIITAQQVRFDEHGGDPEVGHTIQARFQALALAPDGDILLCQSYRLHNGDGLLVTRLSPSGDQVRWAKRIHSPAHDGETVVRAILVDGDGFKLVGFGTEFQYHPGIYNMSAIAINLSGQGELRWIRSLGRIRRSVAHSEHSEEFANAAVATPDGGLLLVGGSNSFSRGPTWWVDQWPSHYDLMLARLSPGGDFAHAGDLLTQLDITDPARVNVFEPPTTSSPLLPTPQAQKLPDLREASVTYSAGEAQLTERLIEPTLEVALSWRTLTSTLPILLDKDKDKAREKEIDADGDGLRQEWENEAIQLVNPYIELDEAETWLESRKGHLSTNARGLPTRLERHQITNFYRVAPYGDNGRGGPAYVLFWCTTAWSLDYGGPGGIKNHRGDSERFIMAWKVVDDYTLEFEWLFTSAHHSATEHSAVWHAAHTSCNRGNISNLAQDKVAEEVLCAELKYAADYRLVLQASGDKHALYPSRAACEDVLLVRGLYDQGYGEDCGEGGRFLFDAFNVGEPERSHQLIDDLAKPEQWQGLTAKQVKLLTGRYPNESIWSGVASRRAVYVGEEPLDDNFGNFCGGLPESDPYPGGCSMRIRDKLTVLPPILQAKLDSRYEVTIATGDFDRAGTDAVVKLTLVSARTASGPFNVYSNQMPGLYIKTEEAGKEAPIEAARLERNGLDWVDLAGDDIGDLISLILAHNDGSDPLLVNDDTWRSLTGPMIVQSRPAASSGNAGWYVDEVQVRRKADNALWVFTPHRWLASDEFPANTPDCTSTGLTLQCSAVPLASAKAVYHVAVITGDEQNAGTDANVRLNIKGNAGATSGELRLDTPDWNDFERNQLDTFLLLGQNVAEPLEITLSHDNDGPTPGWFVGEIVLTNETAGWTRTIRVQQWLEKKGDSPATLTLRLPAGT